VKIPEEQPAQSTGAKVLDSAILVFLFLFAASAPNSIAATQSAWLIGLLLWLVRFAFRPRPRLYKTPVDYFLLGFFILSGLSAFLSYEPMLSVGKLRAASLFTIVYLFAENVPSLRVVRLLALTLLGACMLNVVFTAGQRLLGQGVKVYGVSVNSALYQANVRDGDTLLGVDGQKMRDPQELVNSLYRPDASPASILVYRHELQFAAKVPRGSLLPGSSALEQLGIRDWSKGRDWRASGFYSQYVSYAEVLQLIIALALGIFISLPNKRSIGAVLLLIALSGFCLALLLTITRASWLGSAVSALIILLLTVQRRTVIIIGLLAVPLVLAGLFVLQQKRNVGFLDQRDGSTTWRETVWSEGLHLLVSNPRHLLIGVGMDTIKKRWRQWGLFEGGRLPWGHMHSNLLQIALERGLPALCLWLMLLFVYVRTLWQSLRGGLKLHWIERGILLGALGGLAGFFTSGLVHYNWGDSEVVMVLYLIMGLSLSISRLVRGTSATTI
jgi:O-antigen ligase